MVNQVMSRPSAQSMKIDRAELCAGHQDEVPAELCAGHQDEVTAALVQYVHCGYPVIHDVENFYLQSGATAVSIMQLPMCIGEEVVNEGGGIQNVSLVGQIVGESRQIRVLVEQWTLNLHPNYVPRFLVKTARGWIRAQKPKPVYRRVMNDGLTLAHFLHFVKKHPSSSAIATKEYLSNEFRKFGEQPSIDKLSDLFPVIRRYVEINMDVEKASVLRQFFPHYFREVETSFKIRAMCEDIWQEQQLPHNGILIDLNQEFPDEVQDDEKQGAKSTSSLKASKPQRVSVREELRNLHAQWCSLIGGRATGKGDKKAVSKKSRPEELQNPVSKKSRPEKLQNPVSKKSRPEKLQNHVSRKTRPSKPQKSLSSEHHEPQLTWKLASVPSLESKTSTLKQRKKQRSKVTVPKEEDQEFKGKDLNLKRKEHIKASASDSGNSAPGSSRKGVHSPSRDSLHRLEDPPICTICDDGGDLICCEGPCQRHFHATTGADTPCRTLELTLEQIKKMEVYYCKNCLLSLHQCFICEELGSSAPSVGPQQVYMCDAPGCRKFYHARCVAKVIDQALDWRALADRINRGLHGFLCPRHSCAVCMSKEIQPGVFVQCRRCPKAWHRDCLTDFSASGELLTTSIWKHYDREFIYCKKHQILDNLQTPAQNHLRFPE